MSHAEFIALCESYDTLTDDGRDEALAEIMCYVLQYSEALAHRSAEKYRKQFDRFATEDDYEGYLSSRQGW